jgi:hypothetical protein
MADESRDLSRRRSGGVVEAEVGAGRWEREVYLHGLPGWAPNPEKNRSRTVKALDIDRSFHSRDIGILDPRV